MLELVGTSIRRNRNSFPDGNTHAQFRALKEALIRFVDLLGDDYLTTESWFEFRAWMDIRFDEQSPLVDIFRSWQVFVWKPDLSTVRSSLFQGENSTIAAAYVEFLGDQLESHAAAKLKIAESQPLDLYRIQSVVPGQHVILEGVISGSSVTVYEPNMFRRTDRGNYVLAHVIKVQGQNGVLSGTSPIISKVEKPRIEMFRQLAEKKQSCEDKFSLLQSELLNLFYDLVSK